MGMPSMIGRNWKATFKFVKERIRKINFMSGKFLSIAGCEVMIKSVIQSIPTYVMSAYLIPQSICDEIEIMLNSYKWGTSGKGIRWMSWDKPTMRKEDGGMDF